MPSVVERRFITAIIAFFVMAFAVVLWLVARQVTTEYQLACARDTMRCSVTRMHLAGREQYEIRIPAGARAEVRVTPQRNKAGPRTLLEFVSPTERVFLIEYEWSGANERAHRAAGRLNAFLDGGGDGTLRASEGSGWPAWTAIAFVALVAALGVAGWARRRR